MHVFARGAEEIQPDVCLLLPARQQGRKDRRARNQIHLRCSGKSRTADTSSAKSRCCRSIGGKAPTATARSATSPRRRWSTPLGSGPYRVKEFAAGRSVVLERVKDYWGDNSAGAESAQQFRRAALRVLPRQSGRAGGLQGRPGRLDPGELRQAMGDRLRFSGGDRKTRHQGRNSRSTMSGRMQGFVFNLRRDQFKDVRLRRAFNYAFDFEEMNKQIVLRRLQAHQQLFRRHRACQLGLARRRGTADSRNRARQGPRRGFHQRPMRIRSAAMPKRCATICARAAAVEGGGLPDQGSQAGRRVGKAGQRRIPDVGAADGTPDRCSTSPRSNASASRFRSGPSTMRSTRIACATSISTSSPMSGGSRCRQATSSANSSGSQSADRPGAKNTPGIKNPAVDALIDRIIFAKNRAELVAATARRSIGCCSGISMSCRNTPPTHARYARWDRFSHAEPLPKYGISGFPTLWWWDAEKAAKIGKRS